MIIFPNAKINLGLNITERRADKYHNLETVFYPIPIEDALEITLPATSQKESCLHSSGISVTKEGKDNLVIKAYRLLAESFNLPPINIYLHKTIPSGAGLGGGSSDAAFMLKLLNSKFELNLSNKQLEEYASKLGADCAFFVHNQPAFAEGIGNIFSPIKLSLKNYKIIIVKPAVFVSTQEAFSMVTPHKPEISLKEIICSPPTQWKELMTNDFEHSIFTLHPEIKAIKDKLYDNGAIYSSMSGSGSSVYGLFEPAHQLPQIDFDQSLCFQTILK
ncbi:4-(cytidine 5'-diphospho)-2-C-methyl-D-erythritol kinase [uncultured Bacteroides sp.]|uniref:4-(cytidine 5'-diphospho)-2-C-methyl-D-erythritol kinase n=1 Tax=uncultured Bacteroides sp. TaxID=162156 RepID=UPI002AA737B8|nr:4-(cytidine 5'-diphospho)-2-C-methyl-D-erythritol kinase [uncultured Bacteroides sp.]